MYHTVTRNDLTFRIFDDGILSGYPAGCCGHRVSRCDVLITKPWHPGVSMDYHTPFTGHINTQEKAENVADGILEEYELGKSNKSHPGYRRLYNQLTTVIESKP